MKKSQFMSFYKGNKDAEEAYLYTLSELVEQNYYSPLMLLACLATARIEVGRDFKPIRENISEVKANANYGGRLGNSLLEGYFYRGSGLIQLTGKENYTAFKTTPEKMLEMPESCRVLVAYMKSRGAKKYADQKDWFTVRKLVNGINSKTKKPNGIEEFLLVVEQYLEKSKL